MVTFAALALALLLAAGPAVRAGASEDKVAINMVAVEAIDEGKPDNPQDRTAGKTFDRRLDDAVRKALAWNLPHDSFRQISAARTSVAVKGEARLAVDDAYTVYVSPLSKERDGTLRVRVRIESKSEGENGPVKNVLSSIIKAAPGDTVILGGPTYGAGDLVVAITVSPREKS